MLIELQEPEHIRAMGCGSFEELLDETRITSKMSALRLIAVARAYDEPLARSLGLEKAYALSRYAQVARPRAVPKKLAATDPIIAGTRLRLSRASSRDLYDAARALRDPETSVSSVSRAMQTARGKARRIGAALRRAGLEGIEVHAHRTRSGAGGGADWVQERRLRCGEPWLWSRNQAPSCDTLSSLTHLYNASPPHTIESPLRPSMPPAPRGCAPPF